MLEQLKVEDFLATDHPYLEFASRVFSMFVAPELAKLYSQSSKLLRKPAIDYCFGDASFSGYRLFPGSFYLLLRKCFFPNNTIDSGDVKMAAAIELAHNSTLILDDVLDEHQSRRGRPTLLATYGQGTTILFGSVAILLSNIILTSINKKQFLTKMLKLQTALEECCLGQLFDEPSQWENIPSHLWIDHWWKVCSLKLKVGNVGVYILSVNGVKP